MSSALELFDSAITHPKSASADHLAMARRILRDRLEEPLSSDQAARVLNVSRPTIHAWVRAGLLAKAKAEGRGLQLDAAVVYEVASILAAHPRRRLRLDQLVDEIRDLLQRMEIAAQPSLAQALEEAEAGNVIPYEEAEAAPFIAPRRRGR